MARLKTGAQNSSAAVLDAPNEERERVFDAFRRWGYLEADLDPLGFLRPVSSRSADRRRVRPRSAPCLLRHDRSGVHAHSRSRAATLDSGAAGRPATGGGSAKSAGSADPRRVVRTGVAAALFGQQTLFARRRHRAHSPGGRNSRSRRAAGRRRTGDGNEPSRAAERNRARRQACRRRSFCRI